MMRAALLALLLAAPAAAQTPQPFTVEMTVHREDSTSVPPTWTARVRIEEKDVYASPGTECPAWQAPINFVEVIGTGASAREAQQAALTAALLKLTRMKAELLTYLQSIP